jgi:transcription termination/antitermination protein NusG
MSDVEPTTPDQPAPEAVAEMPAEPAVADAPAAEVASDSSAPVAEPDPVEPEAEAESVPVEAAVATEEPPPSNKKWYVVKVTSGREESIKAAIERRVKIEGLEEYFGQIVIPVERVTVVKKVTEKKNGEKVTKEKRGIKETKKFPGYIMAEVEFNENILYLFRETNGVGDFVGAPAPNKPPAPMSDIEVQRMLGTLPGGKEEANKKGSTVVKLDYEKGDKVRIREGAFANMEGEVKDISTPKEAGETPKVSVEVSIFGRPVPVELEYWQVDKV